MDPWGKYFVEKDTKVLNSIEKTKSMMMKSKTSALKSRILMFSLLRNKKVLLHSISKIFTIF